MYAIWLGLFGFQQSLQLIEQLRFKRLHLLYNLIVGVSRIQNFNGLVKATRTKDGLFSGAPLHLGNSIFMVLDRVDALRLLKIPDLAGVVRGS